MASRSPDPKGPRKKSPIKSARKDVRTTEIEDRRDLPPRHKHCSSCGVSIGPDEEYCSDQCRTSFERMIKRKKQMMWLPYVGIVLIVLFYILIMARS